jgi:hypothetical protein
LSKLTSVVLADLQASYRRDNYAQVAIGIIDLESVRRRPSRSSVPFRRLKRSGNGSSCAAKQRGNACGKHVDDRVGMHVDLGGLV